MKLRIFIARFWKTIFGSKKHTLGVSRGTIEPEHTLKESSPVPTTQPSEIKFFQPEKPLKQQFVTKVNQEGFTETQTERRSKNLTVRSELNLEQNAVFTVSTYRRDSREIIVKDSEGKTERQVIIGRTADGKETGVLTTHHFKLYLALLELWEKAGRPVDSRVHFTVLRILKQLGITDSGSNYETIKRRLMNLSQIPLTFIDSFYLSDRESFSSLKPFQILSYLDIYERRYNTKEKGQITRGYGEFRFHDNILISLINNYSHPLRLDVITGFKKHRDMAILLYTYLDRQLAFKSKYEVGLEKLFDHLDLSQIQIRYPAARKQKIEPVLDEIRGKELSTGILSHAQIRKTADGKDYKLVCRKKPFPRKLGEQVVASQPQLVLPTKAESGSPEAGSESIETESESAKSSSELFPLLIEKRLTQKQAAKLVAEKSPEIINAQLEYLPFRIEEYKAQRKTINEAAILYDSINDNWNVPKGYLEAEKEKEREAQRLKRERIGRLEQEEQDRAEQERVELEAYKEALDPEERAKLRERALAEIRGMEGVKEEFITDILIKAKENEILKAEMEEDVDL